jgi:hypothetical protein
MSVGTNRRRVAGADRARPARAGLAATRGLLLDLLATRDVAGVDAAMDALIDVYEAWIDRTRSEA